MGKNSNVIKYKKPFSLNLGFILFFIIIIYVVFNIFTFFTHKDVAEYEVVQGSIASNNIYQGLAVRDETVIYADRDGYINYYVSNGSKISVLDMIYTIDSDGNIYNAMKSQEGMENGLSGDVLNELSTSISSFMTGYSSLNFNDVLIYKDDLNSDVIQAVNNTMLSQMTEEIEAATKNATFYKGYSKTPGVVLYYVDGYESYQFNSDITVDDLSGNSYTKTNLITQSQVKKDSPIYKLVNDEEWHIFIEVSSDVVELLSDTSNVKIRFCEDDYSTTASYTVNKKNGHYIMDIKLKKAMIRYAGERFIDIELVINEESGLKIPNSSITTKDFYTVPVSYFAQGGDSDSLGILVNYANDDSDSYEFVAPTIYYESEDETYYYIDSEDVSKGDMIMMPGDSSKVYEIGSEIGTLTGVYNINKGYAIFKQINIIYQNEEYAIVEQKTAYGIALYDHIALDASSLIENELIIK